MKEVIFDTPAMQPDGYKWSHLAAEDLPTLHAFAKRIGLKADWFQDKPNKPHYDIKSERVRQLAIREGAKQVTRKELFLKLKEWYGRSV